MASSSTARTHKNPKRIWSIAAAILMAGVLLYFWLKTPQLYPNPNTEWTVKLSPGKTESATVDLSASQVLRFQIVSLSGAASLAVHEPGDVISWQQNLDRDTTLAWIARQQGRHTLTLQSTKPPTELTLSLAKAEEPSRNDSQSFAQALVDEAAKLRAIEPEKREHILREVSHHEVAGAYFETPQQTSAAYNAVGYLYNKIRMFYKAEEPLRQALFLRRRLGNQADIGQTSINLAHSCMGLEKYDEARALLREAVILCDNSGEFADKVSAILTLGGIYEKTSNYENAITCYEEALNSITQLKDPGLKQKLEGHTHQNLGVVYSLMYDYNRSVHHTSKAIQIWDHLNEPIFKIRSHNNQGYNFRNLGKHKEAIAQFKSALNLVAEFGEDPDLQGGCANNIGLEELALGRLDNARVFFRNALVNWGDAQQQGSMLYASFNLALVEMKDGKIDHAKQLLKRVWEALETNNDENLAIQVLDQMALCAHQEGNQQMALDYLATAIKKIEARRKSMKLIDNRTRYLGARIDSFKIAATIMAETYLKTGDPTWAEQAFNMAQRAKARALLDKLTPGETPAPLALKDLEIYFRIERETNFLEYLLGEECSWAFLYSRERLHIYRLPSRKKVNALVAAVKEAIIDQKTTIKVNNQIAKTILAPLEKDLEGSRVVWVPDGSLHQIPLSALPLSFTKEIILDRYDITRTPSWTVWASLSRPEGPAEEWAAVVFADPVFQRSDSRFSKLPNAKITLPTSNLLANKLNRANEQNTYQLKRLYGTRAEAKTLQTLLPGKTKIWCDFDANIENLKHATPKATILHLATHGQLNIVNHEKTALIFSCFDANGLAQPCLLSLEDIAQLNTNARLVVLSACSTADGLMFRGEGPLSLARAFLAKDTPTVLASIWPVEDFVTVELMIEFYVALLNKKARPDQALRIAQRKIQSKPNYKDPFFWAGFVVFGNGF